MLSALICGSAGVLSTFLLGHGHLNLSHLSLLHAIVATNLAGFIAVLFVTNVQYLSWFKARVIPNSLSTWAVFLALYISLTVTFGPRDWGVHEYLALGVPLIFTTGFTIVAFGSVQDRIVRRRQRRARASSGK